jgi:FMN phosphatase YigB (HAD superfamily)
MTLSLLIDLDDTLLSNDIISVFLPAYLKALGKHMNSFVAPDVMIPKLLAATERMIANNDPASSLERVFDQYFYPEIGKTKLELKEVLEQFYDEVYPALNKHTEMRPEAAALIRYAREKGHTVVVATNPLFPRKAILHRLRWAGLDPDVWQFALITTYEYFHYAKPNPAYFAEILAQAGWPDQPTVMIGNSMQEDLLPASQLGLPVFWVSPDAAELPGEFHPLSASGNLSDVPAWIERVEAEGLRQTYTTPAALLAVLKSTPAAFDTLSKSLTDRQWKERPNPGEWSLTEIFGHLRDVDREVNIPRMEKIAAQSNPFVPGIDTDPWAEERDYFYQDGRTALKEYIEARSQLIKHLEALPQAGWRLSARHAIFGPTNIQELVSFIATHDRSHIQQGLAAAAALVDCQIQPGGLSL